MTRRLMRGLGLLAGLSAAWAQDATNPVLKTATNHPMEYFLSLPRNGSLQKKWPMVVVIESANRRFSDTAKLFAEARKDLPFLILVPLVVTNGGAGFRDVPSYHYTDAVWSEIDRNGPFRFDSAGIAAMVTDARRLYGGEGAYFLTGWEAGGHTVWAMIFQHPEDLRAAAPVSTNYAGRWMSAGNFSSAPERTKLPVKVFQIEGSPNPLAAQVAEAKATAAAHGYRNVSVSSVAGKPHGPLADEVLGYFASLLGS